MHQWILERYVYIVRVKSRWPELDIWVSRYEVSTPVGLTFMSWKNMGWHNSSPDLLLGRIMSMGFIISKTACSFEKARANGEVRYNLHHVCHLPLWSYVYKTVRSAASVRHSNGGDDDDRDAAVTMMIGYMQG
jgi:hypothetical protein